MITCSVAFDGVGSLFFFFFNDTATTEIYTLSLHDALPIFGGGDKAEAVAGRLLECPLPDALGALRDALDGLADQDAKDRKSTRLNSSHANISYAVFCLKKKKNKTTQSKLLIHQVNYLNLQN